MIDDTWFYTLQFLDAKSQYYLSRTCTYFYGIIREQLKKHKYVLKMYKRWKHKTFSRSGYQFYLSPAETEHKYIDYELISGNQIKIDHFYTRNNGIFDFQLKTPNVNIDKFEFLCNNTIVLSTHSNKLNNILHKPHFFQLPTLSLFCTELCIRVYTNYDKPVTISVGYIKYPDDLDRQLWGAKHIINDMLIFANGLCGLKYIVQHNNKNSFSNHHALD